MKVRAEQAWFVASFFFSQWAYKYPWLTTGIAIAVGIKEKNMKNLYNMLYQKTVIYIHIYTHNKHKCMHAHLIRFELQTMYKDLK